MPVAVSGLYRNTLAQRLIFALFAFGPAMPLFFLPPVFFRMPLPVFFGSQMAVVSTAYVMKAILICVVWFGVVLAVLLWPPLAKRRMALQRMWHPDALWRAFLAFSVFGSAISLVHLLVEMPASVEQLIHQGSLAPAIGFVLGIHIRREHPESIPSGFGQFLTLALLVLDATVICVVPILLGEATPVALNAIVIVYGLVTMGVSLRHVFLTASALLLLVLIGLPMKEYVRDHWYGGDAYFRMRVVLRPRLAIVQKRPRPVSAQHDVAYLSFDRWGSILRWHRSNGLLLRVVTFAVGRIAIRLDRLSDLAYVVKETPAAIPYAGIATYRPLIGKVIPRVIWRSKPEEEAGQFYGHRYGFLDPSDSTHSVNLPMITEGWMSDGWAGVFGSAAFISIILRFVWAYWVSGHAAPGNVIIGMAILWPVVDGESNFSLVVGGVIYALILYWALESIVRRLGPAARPVPSASTVVRPSSRV